MREYKIDKRQTNPDDKTDYVWFSFEAENDDFTCTASYMLTYVLYNEGWLFEDAKCINEVAEVKDYEPFSSDEIEAVLEEMGYDRWEFEEKYTNLNSIGYGYTAKKESNLLITTYGVMVDYMYSPKTGWSEPYLTESVIAQELGDITGDWSGCHGPIEIYGTFGGARLGPNAPITLDISSVEPFTEENDYEGKGYSVVMNYDYFDGWDTRYSGRFEDLFLTRDNHIELSSSAMQKWECAADIGEARNSKIYIVTGEKLPNGPYIEILDGIGGLKLWTLEKDNY